MTSAELVAAHLDQLVPNPDQRVRAEDLTPSAIERVTPNDTIDKRCGC